MLTAILWKIASLPHHDNHDSSAFPIIIPPIHIAQPPLLGPKYVMKSPQQTSQKSHGFSGYLINLRLEPRMGYFIPAVVKRWPVFVIWSFRWFLFGYILSLKSIPRLMTIPFCWENTPDILTMAHLDIFFSHPGMTSDRCASKTLRPRPPGCLNLCHPCVAMRRLQECLED